MDFAEDRLDRDIILELDTVYRHWAFDMRVEAARQGNGDAEVWYEGLWDALRVENAEDFREYERKTREALGYSEVASSDYGEDEDGNGGSWAAGSESERNGDGECALAEFSGSEADVQVDEPGT